MIVPVDGTEAGGLSVITTSIADNGRLGITQDCEQDIPGVRSWPYCCRKPVVEDMPRVDRATVSSRPSCRYLPEDRSLAKLSALADGAAEALQNGRRTAADRTAHSGCPRVLRPKHNTSPSTRYAEAFAPVGTTPGVCDRGAATRMATNEDQSQSTCDTSMKNENPRESTRRAFISPVDSGFIKADSSFKSPSLKLSSSISTPHRGLTRTV